MGKQDMKIINFLFIISLLITCAYQINIQEILKTKTESKIEENLEAPTEELLESETEGHSLVKINESLVSQASPYSNNRFPATNAFDNKFTHTNKGKGMWWKVKFPVKYNFSKIRIKNRANCCPGRLDLTKVYVSGKLCGTIPKGTKKNTWYEVTCNLTGNEIKLVTTQNTYLSIQGFKAYAGTAAIAIPTPVVDPIPQILVINKPKPVAQILVINKPAVLPVVSTPAPSPTPAFGGFYEIEFFTAAQGLIDIETLRN